MSRWVCHQEGLQRAKLVFVNLHNVLILKLICTLNTVQCLVLIIYIFHSHAHTKLKTENQKLEWRVYTVLIAPKIKSDSKNEADTNYYQNNTTTSMDKPLSSLKSLFGKRIQWIGDIYNLALDKGSSILEDHS